MNFSFESLSAIWLLSPQQFYYYFCLSIVSWQYQKYSTILILVLCLLCQCVTPLESIVLSDDRLNSRMYCRLCSMILVNHYAIWPPISKTIFIKHSRVEIIAFPCVLFHREPFFNVCGCLFRQRLSAAYLLKLLLLPQRAHTTLFIRRDKPELTRWCLCSLHAGVQMSPDEVVGCRDGCRHSIAESTVDVPIRLCWQIFSARTALFSCPFA